ncbi:MAG: hypothetical protein JXJ04_17620 [Spirochaetales bacterium]|nr:hypothetical protein [Spirochaetales bacterium]
MLKKQNVIFCIILLFTLSVLPVFSRDIGDVNGNGTVDIVDALLVAQYYVQLDPPLFDPSVADVNCDSDIDIVDALIIARYYVSIILELGECDTPSDPPAGTEIPDLTPAPTLIGTQSATPVPQVTPIIDITPAPELTATPDPTEDPGDFNINPPNIDFGTIMPGEMAVAPLTCENDTTHTITVSAITLSQPEVFGFGSNSSGQLGVSLVNSSYTHIPHGIALEDVVQVETFYSTSFFVTSQGALWGCGYNSRGQLGDGTTGHKAFPVQILSGGVQKVSAGMSHTLILMNDGSLLGCGSGERGILGLGDLSSYAVTPVEIMSSGVRDISAGGAFSLILKDDNTLWVCGINFHGQLGLGHTDDVLTPTLVMENVSQINAGWNHSTVIKSDGSLWTTGQNSDGELGNGEFIDSYVFTKVIAGNVVEAAAGSNFTLARLSNNTLVGVGANTQGQLGNDYFTNTTTFISIDVNVYAINTGALHTLYLKEDGTLWGCGAGSQGQLGEPSTAYIYNPIVVMESGVIDFSGGFTHSLVLRASTEEVYSHTGSTAIIEPGRSYTFDVILDTETTGIFGGIIALQLDLVRTPILHIPVWGSVSE